jgi:hypothetical protein
LFSFRWKPAIQPQHFLQDPLVYFFSSLAYARKAPRYHIGKICSDVPAVALATKLKSISLPALF